jgi:hypothetical protein
LKKGKRKKRNKAALRDIPTCIIDEGKYVVFCLSAHSVFEFSENYITLDLFLARISRSLGLAKTMSEPEKISDASTLTGENPTQDEDRLEQQQQQQPPAQDDEFKEGGYGW